MAVGWHTQFFAREKTIKPLAEYLARKPVNPDQGARALRDMIARRAARQAERRSARADGADT